MTKTYRAWNPDQSWLLPPSPQDWLPEDDLVYFLMDVVGQLDISAITQVYEKSDRGYPPFHPRMMVCLLIYSYAMGVRSSRQIAQRCRRDLGWRVIAGADIPDFRTICGFRKTHVATFSALFIQVLQICQRSGLVTLGHLSLDGTKIKANASRHKAMSYGRMLEEEARLKGEIAVLLGEAQAQDAAEDARLGDTDQAGKLPEELIRRETRLQRIKEARSMLEARYQVVVEKQPVVKEAAQGPDSQDNEPGQGASPAVNRNAASVVSASPATVVVPEKAQINFTDPESRIMKASNKGWDQCGNAQAVVDGAGQIIVAADVTDQANDVRQVIPMLKQAQENVGEDQTLEKVSADAGYFSEENVNWMEQNQIDAYVATGRLKHGEKPMASPCGRIPQSLTVKERMIRKLRTQKGRTIYARRKAIVEPVFGQIKQAMGFRQFLMRGLRQMQGEWKLVCLSYNVRKMFRAFQLGAT